MADRATVSAWLDKYVEAWKSYDPHIIGDLFSEEALYYYDPFQEPISGRSSIVSSWLEDPDLPGSFSAHYELIAIDGDVAVANGRTTYMEDDSVTIDSEFDNIFILRFDADGRCSEYREWYMQAPNLADGD